VAYVTAKHLGNILYVGLLCCSESPKAALHFTWPVEISALIEFLAWCEVT